jgi:hypothetical protein
VDGQFLTGLAGAFGNPVLAKAPTMLSVCSPIVDVESAMRDTRR